MPLALFGNLLDNLAEALVGALYGVLNAFITAVATVLEAVRSILPEMPDLPTPPDSLVTAEGWVAWVFPVGTLLDVLAFVVSMVVIWEVVVLVLRWAKAHEGSSS
jgi:hypothetical protein